MSKDDYPRSDVPTFTIGIKAISISNEQAPFQKNIFDFKNNDKYVDVTLQFDDGKQIPCHRCLLACSSGYFDRLFSSDTKESGAGDPIHLVDVSSSTFSTALEFVYGGQCSFTYDDFLELLLVANKLEFKDLEDVLFRHLIAMHEDKVKSDFESAKLHGYRYPYTLFNMNPSALEERRYKHAALVRNEKGRDVADFFVGAWVFFRQPSIKAESLMIDIKNQSNPTRIPLKSYVMNCLKSHYYQAHSLLNSKKLLSLDFESLIDFLDDTGFVDDRPSIAFKIASAWLQGGKHRGKPNVEDAETKAHFDALFAHLRLNTLMCEDLVIWGEDSPYLDRIIDLYDMHKLHKFLIIPDTNEALGFICHNLSTGENFYLDPPTTPELEGKFYGAPKLTVGQNSYFTTLEMAASPVSRKQLRCVRGVRNGTATPSFVSFKYSFSRNRWIQEPGTDDEIAQNQSTILPENAPLELVDFLTPSHSDSSDDFIVKVGCDYRKSIKTKSTPSQQSRSGDDKENQQAQENSLSNIPPNHPRNVAEIALIDMDDKKESNLWKNRIASVEISGVGVYTGHRDNKSGVLLFGNTYAQKGRSKKESLVLLDRAKLLGGFPDGACETPLSIVSLEEKSVFVIASAPFTTADDGNDHLTLKLPMVWALGKSCDELSSNELQWCSFSTPCCPDLDYVALYFDQQLSLILVQKPPSEAPFSQVYDRKSGKPRQQIKGHDKGTRSEGNREIMARRIVGRYVFNPNVERIQSGIHD